MEIKYSALYGRKVWAPTLMSFICKAKVPGISLVGAILVLSLWSLCVLHISMCVYFRCSGFLLQ